MLLYSFLFQSPHKTNLFKKKKKPNAKALHMQQRKESNYFDTEGQIRFDPKACAESPLLPGARANPMIGVLNCPLN